MKSRLGGSQVILPENWSSSVVGRWYGPFWDSHPILAVLHCRGDLNQPKPTFSRQKHIDMCRDQWCLDAVESKKVSHGSQKVRYSLASCGGVGW